MKLNNIFSSILINFSEIIISLIVYYILKTYLRDEIRHFEIDGKYQIGVDFDRNFPQQILR